MPLTIIVEDQKPRVRLIDIPPGTLFRGSIIGTFVTEAGIWYRSSHHAINLSSGSVACRCLDPSGTLDAGSAIRSAGARYEVVDYEELDGTLTVSPKQS
jgi:hypothetical protein